MPQVIEVIKHTDVYTQYDGPDGLNISEFFTNTIQGEGVHAGHPAVFLRLQGCIHNCIFCDTRQIWKNGNRISFESLLISMREHAYKQFTENDAHLVITGGAPLQQQKSLIRFLRELKEDYRKREEKELFVEIENEAGVEPRPALIELIDCWNNSPKLKNSLVNRAIRFNLRALKVLNRIPDSWFKFVISKPTDWTEIEKEYLPHIDKEKILLMPMGMTNEELDKTLPLVKKIGKEHSVMVIDRIHIRENKK